MKSLMSNLIKYILINYQYKSDISASRLIKMLYLADWKSAIENGKQITDATWHFYHYGPYVDDFLNIARGDSDIKVVNTSNMFGSRKQQIELRNDFDSEILLSRDQKELLDFVIEATKDKNYDDFIKLVYSTYPVVSSSRYSDFDLVKMAQEYKHLTETKL